MDSSKMDDTLNTGMNELDLEADLEAMFGTSEEEFQNMEKVVLTQNLEGFASCFPDWDLHPPVKC